MLIPRKPAQWRTKQKKLNFLCIKVHISEIIESCSSCRLSKCLVQNGSSYESESFCRDAQKYISTVLQSLLSQCKLMGITFVRMV